MDLAESLTSPHVLDHVLGMHVLTYFRSSACLDIRIPRPHGFVVSEIVDDTDIRCLKLERCTEASKHCVYLVEKREYSTIDVAKDLMRFLKCSKARYLGLKEARAIAYQLLILSDCEHVVNDVARSWGKASLIACSDTPPYFNHRGNVFDLLLECNEPNALLSRIEELRNLSKGRSLRILNFFGYQRFGSRRPITHIVGASILRGDSETALSMLCTQTLAWGPPPKRGYERRVCRKGTLAIDKRLLRLFLQAYQSYLFNKALSITWIEILRDCGLDIECALELLERNECFVLGSGIDLRRVWEPYASSYRKVLSIEGLDIEDFEKVLVRKFLKPVKRPCITKVEVIEALKRDSSILLKVFLPRGSYVTVFLRELNPCDIQRVL